MPGVAIVEKVIPRRTKPLELWLTRQVLEGLVGLTRRLSHRSALALGAGIGTAAYSLFPRYRRVALKNLSHVYGDTWSCRQIEATAREAFRNVGRTLAEFARLPATPPEEIERLLRLEGLEHLNAALARGRGALLISAHYGNWELLAAAVAQRGYKANVIVRPFGYAALDATLREIRASGGYAVIERNQSLRPALECLRRNECLAMLIDQNAVTSSVWVEFFGRPAATPMGPAVIARRTGAALVSLFDRRLPDGTHAGRIDPPIFLQPKEDEDKERDIRDIMAGLTQRVEQEVLGDPTQWLWLHDRWKRQPEPGELLNGRVPGSGHWELGE